MNQDGEIVKWLLIEAVRENRMDRVKYFLSLLDPLHRASVLHEGFRVAVDFAIPQMLDFFLQSGVDADTCRFNGITALGKVARSNQPECVQLLMAANADVNAIFPTNKTPLHLAASGGSLESVNLLLKAGADVHAVDDENFTPLLDSLAKKFRIDVITLLLTAGSQVYPNKSQGMVTLSRVAGLGQAECMELFIKSMDFKEDALSAAARGDFETLEKLFHTGCAVDSTGCHDFTALMIVTIIQDLKCMRLLLENNASVDMLDCTQYSALAYAFMLGFTEGVKLLIEFGATKISDGPSGQCLATITSKNGKRECFELLVNEFIMKDPALIAKSVCEIQHLVQYALCEKFLIFSWELPLNIDKVSQFFCLHTLFLAMTEGDNFQNLNFCLQNLPCDVKATGVKALAMTVATQKGNVNCLQTLLENGVDVDTKIFDKQTCLMHACVWGQEKCLEVLLKWNAKIFLLDHLKRSAVAHAVKHGQTKCLRILLQYVSEWLERLNDIQKNPGEPISSSIDIDDHEYVDRQFTKILTQRASDGMTLLELASVSGNRDCLELLLEMNVNLRPTTEELTYNLTRASVKNQAESIEVIVARVSIDKVPVHAVTAIMVAGSLKCLHIILKSWGLNMEYFVVCMEQLYRPSSIILYTGNPLDQINNQELRSRLLYRALVYNCVKPCLLKWNHSKWTPLQLAFLFEDLSLIRYLLANLYVTKDDVNANRWKELLGHMKITEKTEAKLVKNKMVQQFSTNIFPLSVLSYVTISDCLASGKARKEQVNTLGLPEFHRRNLSFSNDLTRLCILQWNEIGRRDSKIWVTDAWELASLHKANHPVNQQLLPCMCTWCVGIGLRIDNYTG